MSPAKLLDFRGWHSRFNLADCALDSSAAMTPGAYRYRYRALLE